MSDTYNPNPAPRTPMPQSAFRDSAYTDRPVNPALLARPPSDGSGLGTGLLVVCVFAVVAVLALALYSPRDAAPAVAPAAPAVVLESDGGVVPTPPEATPAIEPAIDPVTADQPAAAETGTAAPGTDATGEDPAPVPPAAEPAAPATQP
jgi:hypothetical protein